MKSIKYLVVLVTLYVMANPAILLLPSITAVQAGNYSHNHNTQAKTCYVDAIKYRNKGAYNVQDLGFHWVQSTPDHNEAMIDGFTFGAHSLMVDLDKGESATIKLKTYTSGVNVGGNQYMLRDGNEVWIKVNITAGEHKSCHKKNHKLIYKEGVGKTMKFKSGGTTLNNNRCKYNGNMDNDCYTGE